MTNIREFNLTFPDNSLYTIPPTATSLTLYSFQTGHFLSLFSGSLINTTSGSTIEDFGLDVKANATESRFCLTLNVSGSTPEGYIEDIIYTVIVYDYHAMATLNTYSGSTIGEMSIETLGQLIVL